jgi:hypothetical protein
MLQIRVCFSTSVIKLECAHTNVSTEPSILAWRWIEEDTRTVLDIT